MIAEARSTSQTRTSFIGRNRESAALQRELRRGSRLLSLVGPSGVGKTRLARHLLDSGDRRVGSALFVELAGCHSAGDLQAAIAESLSIPFRDGSALGQALANRGPTLLILDNFEDVAAEARSLLEHWLDTCAGLQILITSIIPAGIDGEIRFELGPLEPGDAVALYIERAHQAWADRVFSDADRTAVEELVGRLDGSPLAIELAAARIRILPPRILLSRIDERFDLLQSKRQGHQGSLHRAISLTWEFLSDRERQVLARCSVFAGGFTLEAAEEILPDEGEEAELLDVLDDLRGKALLQLDDSELPRISLYESIREFAARELERSGQQSEFFRRHARYYAERGVREAAHFDGPEIPAAIRWLSAERKNLLAAHRRCFPPASISTKLVNDGASRLPDGPPDFSRLLEEFQPTRGPDSDLAELAAKAGLALSSLLLVEGPPRSAQDLFETTVRAALASGEVVQLGEALRGQIRWIRRYHGAVPEALSMVKIGLRLMRASSEPRMEALLLIQSGLLKVRINTFREGIADLEQALQIAREIGDSLVEGDVLHFLGVAWESSASEEWAKKRIGHIQQALLIFRRGQHLLREGRALFHLMETCTRMEQFREARIAYAEARVAFGKLEVASAEADAVSKLLANVGVLELAAGGLDEAELYLKEALEMLRKLGDRRFEAVALRALGVVAIERGDFLLGQEQLLEAIRIMGDIEGAGFKAESLCFLTAAEAHLGKFEEARRGLAQAREFFSARRVEEGNVLVELMELVPDLVEARVRAGEGRREEAVALEERARTRLAAKLAAAHRLKSDTLAIARRIVQRLASREHIVSASTESSRRLLVGEGAAWFVLGDGERVEMRSPMSARRILEALVEARRSQPGEGLSQQELFVIGWGDEKAHPRAAAARVYVAIRILRTRGLAEILLRQTDGYLLDPEFSVVRANETLSRIA